MIRKWLKTLIEYLFGDYLAELRAIHVELVLLRADINKPAPIEVDANMPLGPIRPLKFGGSIFGSPMED